MLSSFRQPDEVLSLREVADRAGLNKVTAFRLLTTLEGKHFVERVGRHGYRSCIRTANSRQFRIGYAEQSTVVPYIRTVTESLQAAAEATRVSLVIVNNRARRKTALQNADALIKEGIDLAIEFQLIADIAPAVSERFLSAGIPVIAVDNPHPGAIYFGGDSYKAGHMGGVHLAHWAVQNWNRDVEELLLFPAQIGGPILEARLAGIMDGLTSAMPSARGLTPIRLETQSRFEDTLDVVRKHLRRSRATRILVASVNDPSALGALQAFREYGREEHCAVVGQGCVAEARHEMRRPGTRLIGSVAYFPERYGPRLIALALDILQKRPVPHAVFTQHQVVTPANVNKIYANDLLLGYSATTGTLPDEAPRGTSKSAYAELQRQFSGRQFHVTK